MVEWTDHALAKAQFLDIARADVEDAIHAQHERRSRNTRAADWLVSRAASPSRTTLRPTS